MVLPAHDSPKGEDGSQGAIKGFLELVVQQQSLTYPHCGYESVINEIHRYAILNMAH